MNLPSQFSGPVLVGRARVLKIVVWVVSILVLGLVVMMRSPYKIPVSEEAAGLLAHLPRVVAGINTLVAVSLLAGLWSVVRQNYRAHQRWMTTALVLSGIFLICYVAYHFTTLETKFGDIDADRKLSEDELENVGKVRYVYLGILLTHIVAAAVSFPLILMTFVHAWTRNFEKHRKLARKVFPLWLYVAITGPICYWMLKDYYQ